MNTENQKPITTGAQTNMFGRKNGKYVSTFCGVWDCVANSKEAAQAGLVESIKTAMRFAFFRRYVLAANGKTIFALYHTPGSGWAYDILQPDALKEYRGSSCMMGEISEQAAREACDKHAASYTD